MDAVANLLRSAGIIIEIDGEDKRPTIEVPAGNKEKDKDQKIKKPLYRKGDTIKGTVHINLKGKQLDHNGIQVDLVGVIELMYDRSSKFEFFILTQAVQGAGRLTSSTSYKFEFKDVDFKQETYHGINVRLRYLVRVIIRRRLADISQDKELRVQQYQSMIESNNSIKMEVGIENALHIEFEYNKSKYALKDVIVGKIYFILVRIKVTRMELSIIKKETTGSGSSAYNESETVAKFEIMDGSPTKGESIPVRLYLNGFDLTPTFKEVDNKFSVRYFLNLVLIDEDDRRYFKQQEIVLWRKASQANTVIEYNRSVKESEEPEEQDRKSVV